MFFDRITRSFELARSSWRVLVSDKKLVVFPVLSGIAALIVFVSFAIPVGVIYANVLGAPGLENADPENVHNLPDWVQPVGYAILFAFYFCSYFVIVFFNSALVSCALMRFNGQETTLGDGLRAAASRLPQIVAWALVSATVGVLLRAIESNRQVGRIVSSLLGTAWTIITYFVVPVLVVEKTGPFKAIGRSIELLKKTWGEALIGNFGLGFFEFLVVMPGILILIVGGVLCASILPVGIAVLAIGVIYLLAAAAVCATLRSIFQSALYQYAAYDQAPIGFDEDTLAHAFEPKN